MTTKSSAIQVKEIAFTAYPVSDVARARAFYEGLLNLKTGVGFEHGDKAWIEYDVGPATIAISNMSGDQWKPSSDGPNVALEVGDFDAAVTTLRAAGVRFAVEPMDFPSCRMAGVLDPDGNALMIHFRKPPQG